MLKYMHHWIKQSEYVCTCLMGPGPAHAKYTLLYIVNAVWSDDMEYGSYLDNKIYTMYQTASDTHK